MDEIDFWETIAELKIRIHLLESGYLTILQLSDVEMKDGDTAREIAGDLINAK